MSEIYFTVSDESWWKSQSLKIMTTTYNTSEPLMRTEADIPVDRRYDFWEYRLSLDIQAYGSLVVAILGVIGNSLAIAVLTTGYPMNSSTVYLIQLAVSDLMATCIGQVSRNIPRAWTGYDIGHYHPYVCKMWFVVNHSLITISAWTLVAVTVERVIIVYFPLKAKSVISTGRARATIIVIDILCLILHLHYFFTYGPVYGSDGQVTNPCAVVEGSEVQMYYISRVRPWQDLVFRTAAPFFTLLMCNCLIVFRLFQHMRHSKQLVEGNSVKSNKKTKAMTKMLLMISFAFLFLVSPLQIMYVVDTSGPFNWIISERWQAIVALRWGIAIPLYYLNNALNFILYCMSGQEFRKALKNLAMKIFGRLSMTATCCKGVERGQIYETKSVSTVTLTIRTNNVSDTAELDHETGVSHM